MKSANILVVDDEQDILDLIEYNLSQAGHKVFCATNGEEGIQVAKTKNPDLIILDIMMPKLGGIEVCSYLRNLEEFKNTLIVFLTARNDEITEVTGFNVGAHDYITKPIKPNALVSRINALDQENMELSFEGLLIDKGSYSVTLNGKKCFFTKKEFDILHFLATKPGRIYSRDQLLDEIWGDDVVVSSRNIDVHIRKIREKLGDHIITTIKGVGYKFNEN